MSAPTIYTIDQTEIKSCLVYIGAIARTTYGKRRPRRTRWFMRGCIGTDRLQLVGVYKLSDGSEREITMALA